MRLRGGGDARARELNAAPSRTPPRASSSGRSKAGSLGEQERATQHGRRSHRVDPGVPPDLAEGRRESVAIAESTSRAANDRPTSFATALALPPVASASFGLGGLIAAIAARTASRAISSSCLLGGSLAGAAGSA